MPTDRKVVHAPARGSDAGSPGTHQPWTTEMTSDTTDSKDIPHRFWLLVMLRSLAKGHPLVVTGPASFQSFLDGLPHVAILFQYILEHEWIAERESRDGIHFYRITRRGFDFWREGEQWWRSLTWSDRLRVRQEG